MNSSRRSVGKAAKLWEAVAELRREAAELAAKADRALVRATAHASTRGAYMAALAGHVAAYAKATEIKLRAARMEWEGAELVRARQARVGRGPRAARIAPLSIPQIIDVKRAFEVQLFEGPKSKRHASAAAGGTR